MSDLDDLQWPQDRSMPDVTIRLYRKLPLQELGGRNGLTRFNLWKLPERQAVLRERYGFTRFGEEVHPLSDWLIGRVAQVFGQPLQFDYDSRYREQSTSQLAALWAWYGEKEYIRTAELSRVMEDASIPYHLLAELDLVDGLFHRLMIWRSTTDQDNLLVGVTCGVVDGKYVRARYTRLVRWGRNLSSDHSIEQTANQMPRFVVDAILALQGGMRPRTTALTTATSSLPVVKPQRSALLQWPSPEPTDTKPQARPDGSDATRHVNRTAVLLVLIVLLVIWSFIGAVVWPDVFPFTLLN